MPFLQCQLSHANASCSKLRFVQMKHDMLLGSCSLLWSSQPRACQNVQKLA